MTYEIKPIRFSGFKLQLPAPATTPAGFNSTPDPEERVEFCLCMNPQAEALMELLAAVELGAAAASQEIESIKAWRARHGLPLNLRKLDEFLRSHSDGDQSSLRDWATEVFSTEDRPTSM